MQVLESILLILCGAQLQPAIDGEGYLWIYKSVSFWKAGIINCTPASGESVDVCCSSYDWATCLGCALGV